MTNINSQKMAYNNLNFNITTSSGDKISLSMYDKKDISFSDTKKGNITQKNFTLTHAYGYEFHYRGNGIDANDQKEIDEALKKIRPQIEKYMEDVKHTGIPTPRDVLQKAIHIRKHLPQAQNENHKNTMADAMLKMFDELTPKYFPNTDMLQTSKTLFDTIFRELDSFSLYV